MKKLLTLTLIILSVFAQTSWAEVKLSSSASELKNRFRVDHMVDKMVLLVQRDYGSAPVVIVLPDGSKWYAQRHPDEVKWVDGVTGDMIEIPHPVPGPWQLLGKVSAGSTIDKISALSIEVEPLPQPLFQGERVKVTAKLMGDAQRVRMPGLDYLVEWTAKFVSEHDSEDENFAAGTFIVGAYKDEGEELDERPDDGVFTGKINLNQPWGKYRFIVNARNNIFDREFSMPFVLSPNPIAVKMIDPDDPQTGQWKLSLKADPAVVKLEDTHFAFELVGPAGFQMPLNLQGMSSAESEIVLPKVTEFGSYRIKGQVATTTVSGREILIQLPEHFFNLIEPPAPPPSAEELAARAAAIAVVEEEKAKSDVIFWVITVNLGLLLLGVLGLIFWRKRQTLALALAAAEQAMLEEEQANKPSAPELDDIDLTLPDMDLKS